jgi:hypothetical protein
LLDNIEKIESIVQQMVIGMISAWDVQDVTANYSRNSAKFKELISQVRDHHHTQNCLGEK